MDVKTKTKEKRFVSVKQFTGIESQTLRKLGDSQKIECYRTPTGQRRFNKCSLEAFCNSINNAVLTENKRKNFIYARVSSRKQMDDLSRQIEYLQRERPEGTDGNEFMLISDIGSGINFKRKGIQTILEACLQGSIGTIVIAHRDRLCRFGYELLESLINKAGGSIVDLSNQEEHKSSEQELAEDLLSIVHIRQMGKRSYKGSKRNSEGNTEGTASKSVENKDVSDT